MVFQSFNLFNNMTALNNCITGQVSVLKRSREEAEAIAMKYLERVGMAPYINARPSQLSGGMRRRVAIVRAVMSGAETVYFDEPFTGIDDATKKLVIEYILNNCEGRTLVFVSHCPDDAKLLNAKELRI